MAMHVVCPLVVALLLTSPASADDDSGVPSLQLAAKRGDLVIMKQMLEAGAHVNEFNSRGETALMIATRRGYTAAVTLLSV